MNSKVVVVRKIAAHSNQTRVLVEFASGTQEITRDFIIYVLVCVCTLKLVLNPKVEKKIE